MRRLVQISDIHFGADDPEAVRALGEDLRAHPYDLLIVSGDFTQRARASQFKAAMAFLDPLAGPKLFVPGNHDVPLHNLVRRFATPLGKYRKYVTKETRPVFQDDEVLVMGLNTARPFSFSWHGFWKDGRINADQLLDVHLTCLEAPKELFRVLVTHHPFIPPPGERPHGMVEMEGEGDEDATTTQAKRVEQPGKPAKLDKRVVHGSRRALRTLEAVHVDLLLAGHLHQNYSGDVRDHHAAVRRSILSVQAGTACSHRVRGEPNAYNVITIESPHFDEVEDARLTVQVRVLKNGAFTDGDRRVYECRDGGWKSM